MPTTFNALEQSLPRINDQRGLDERVDNITSYLYQLVELMRWTLSNLGENNFNVTELDNISANISEPLETDIDYIVKSLVGDDGTIAELIAAPGAVLSRLSDSEGRISTISQTVNGLTLEVSNGSTSSTIKLLSSSMELASQRIYFSGMVTFSDLSGEGTTTINGSNITTGTITAIDISGCTITGSLFESILESDGSASGALSFYYVNRDNLAGGIVLDDNGSGSTWEAKYRIYLYTSTVRGVPFGLKLESAGGMSLESYESVYIYAPDYVTIDSDGDVEIRNPVLLDSDGGTWTFSSEGIFRDGALVAPIGDSNSAGTGEKQ